MLIGYRDYIQDATLTDIGFGTWGTTLDNVKDRRLAVPAIYSTDEFLIRATWSEDVTIGMLAVLAHNFRQNGFPASYSVSLYDASNNIIEVLSGNDIWYPPAASQFPRNIFAIFQQNHTNVRKMEYEATAALTDAQIGRLFAGPVFQPEGKTAQRDFHMHTRDDSVVKRSIGQQVYVDYKPRYRQLTCAIPYLTEAEAIGTVDGETQNLQDISFEVGRGGEVIVIPSTHSDQVVHKFGVYGHFLEPPTVHLLDANRQKGRLYSTEFDVVETL